MTSLPTTPCRGCGKEIVFASITKADGTPGTVPLDPKAPCYSVRDAGGSVVAERIVGSRPTEEVLVSHFATCPKASSFSKGRGAASPQDEIDDLRKRLQAALDRVAVLEARGR